MATSIFEKRGYPPTPKTLHDLREIVNSKRPVSQISLATVLDPVVIPVYSDVPSDEIVRFAYTEAGCLVASPHDVLFQRVTTHTESKEVRTIRFTLRANGNIHYVLGLMRQPGTPELVAVKGGDVFFIKILPEDSKTSLLEFLSFWLATCETIPTEIVQIFRKSHKMPHNA